MFRCECGARFEHPKIVYESRGEFWGIPCSEPVGYCPYCGDDCFYDEDDWEDEEDEE